MQYGRLVPSSSFHSAVFASSLVLFAGVRRGFYLCVRQWGSQAWNPASSSGVCSLKGCRREPQKIIQGLEKTPDHERLQKLRCLCSSNGRLRRDGVTVQKDPHGENILGTEGLFILAEKTSRLNVKTKPSQIRRELQISNREVDSPMEETTKELVDSPSSGCLLGRWFGQTQVIGLNIGVPG